MTHLKRTKTHYFKLVKAKKKISKQKRPSQSIVKDFIQSLSKIYYFLFSVNGNCNLVQLSSCYLLLCPSVIQLNKSQLLSVCTLNHHNNVDGQFVYMGELDSLLGDLISCGH